MKLRAFVLPFIPAFLLSLCTMAAACGGDDDGELTLEEYFHRLGAILDERLERIERNEEEFDPEESDVLEERLELALGFFGGMALIVEDYLDALDDLEPPPEVQEAHNDELDAGSEAIEGLQLFMERLADVESSSELEEAIDDPELDSALKRLGDTCFKLADIAVDRGIDVRLAC